MTELLTPRQWAGAEDFVINSLLMQPRVREPLEAFARRMAEKYAKPEKEHMRKLMEEHR